MYGSCKKNAGRGPGVRCVPGAGPGGHQAHPDKNRLPTKPVGVDLPGELLLQTGHAAWVTSVAFSPDGQLLASGGADGTTKLWAVQSREVLRTLSGPTAEGIAVAFSPDGKLLASACADGTVNMWTIQSGNWPSP